MVPSVPAFSAPAAPLCIGGARFVPGAWDLRHLRDFLILRALGELVLHRPSSGSFVAREFYGEKRWPSSPGGCYFLNWAMTGIVDTTAITRTVLGAFQPIPRWTHWR